MGGGLQIGGDPVSLGWRLILSYIIIILVTLFFAFVTLIVISGSVQNVLATARLTNQSRIAQRQINRLYRQNRSNERIIQQFNERATNINSHLLLVNTQGKVLADSKQAWTGQQISLSEQDSGSFQSPEGRSFMYAASSFGPPDQPAGYIIALSDRSPLTTLLAELGGGFILAGIIALLVSLLLGVFIARSIVTPLKRVAEATSAVAAGDYEHRLPATGPPEIKRVATSFNVMADQVQASQKAMHDFVSNVSHELKTPLTSIQGFSQAIMEGATQNEAARRRAAGIIHQEAARMSRLVEDLLDLARIDSGQVVMHKTPLNLGHILTNTVQRLLPQALKKDVALLKDWGKLPTIVGDGDRLAQVFTNFLDNAIKHTPKGGQVTIKGSIAKGIPRLRPVRAGLVKRDAVTTISERSDFVEISIIDTGPGIPPEDLARIFERFYQVDKSRKRGQGMGLGLAITQEIIEAHAGYVRASSTPGEGTKFVVLLPITEANARTLITPQR